MTTLYVSGPMTGYPEFNFPAFHKAAARLRDAGYLVINPAENWGGATNVPREQCMELDLHQVLCSDGIALLPYWQASEGALLERNVAKQTGRKVKPVDWWLEDRQLAWYTDALRLAE